MTDEMLNLQMEVLIKNEEGDATIVLPPEVRLTERLVANLDTILKQKGLTLKHWTLSPEQQEDLKRLSNVVVQEGEKTGD